MTEILLYILIALCTLIPVLLVALLLRRQKPTGDLSALMGAMEHENKLLLDQIGRLMAMSQNADAKSMETLRISVSERVSDLERRIEDMVKVNEYRFDEMKRILIDSIRRLTEDNAKQLDSMRMTVDEKLNATLETRLNKSFEIINSRLEAVYKGLGEMQGLAKGVGDIKRVLTNVKVRGTYGEVQLGNLLEQILNRSQFAASVKVNPRTDELVDYVIRLPGKDEEEVLLPVDCKFPMEQYQRLISASESGDAEETERQAKSLESAVKLQAKKISDKYICPPATTDFAILYLPVEGLYAEVLRRDGLVESLQAMKILVCGPTTIGALLNSLQMGFKTVAIEKRSSELWHLLAAFKTEFGKFSDILAKTQKKISEASDTLDDAARKSRTISKKLGAVELEEVAAAED